MRMLGKTVSPYKPCTQGPLSGQQLLMLLEVHASTAYSYTYIHHIYPHTGYSQGTSTTYYDPVFMVSSHRAIG